MFTPLADSLFPERLFLRFRAAQVAFHSDRLRFMRWVERHFRPVVELERDPAATLDRFRVDADAQGRFHIADEDADRIVGLDSEDAGYVFWQLKDEIVLRLMQRARDLAWLHAGGAVDPVSGRAALVVGPAGGGKSTLSGALGGAGWRYLADDLLPVDLGAGIAWPFPLTAHIRRPAEEFVPEERIGWLAKDHLDFGPERIARGPAPIGALLLTEYQPGAGVRLEPAPPSIAVVKLAGYCQNFPDYDGDAFAGLCRLVERVAPWQLVHGGAHLAADEVVRWAVARVAAAAGGA